MPLTRERFETHLWREAAKLQLWASRKSTSPADVAWATEAIAAISALVSETPGRATPIATAVEDQKPLGSVTRARAANRFGSDRRLTGARAGSHDADIGEQNDRPATGTVASARRRRRTG